MSHELRTPLNAIIGFCEVLHEQMFGELNERQLAYVDDVLEAGPPPARADQRRARPRQDRGRADGARALRGRHPRRFSDSAVTMHAERASRGGIALGLSVDPTRSPIAADERQVRQIVFNLLSNAVKFTPAGRPRRRLRPAGRTASSRSPSPTPGPGSPPRTSSRSSRSSSRPATASSRRAQASGSAVPQARRAPRRPPLGRERARRAAAPSASRCPIRQEVRREPS